MRSNKKAFTIVELVIVIAVIAILAAVLIPTFSGIIKKANLSNDVQTCKNMNTQLVVKRATEAPLPENIVEAKTTLSDTGFGNSFTPKSDGYHYYWCEADNCVYLVNDTNAFEINFPETETEVTATNSYRLDKEVFSITCSIEGITLDKKLVAEGSTNVEITLTATDVDMPSKVKIGDTEYSIANNKITVKSITSNIVINECVVTWKSLSATVGLTTVNYYPVLGGTNPAPTKFAYSTDGTNFTEISATGAENTYQMSDVASYAKAGTLYYSGGSVLAVRSVNNISWNGTFKDNSGSSYPYYASTNYDDLQDGIKGQIDGTNETIQGLSNENDSINGVRLKDIYSIYNSDKQTNGFGGVNGYFWTNNVHNTSQSFCYENGTKFDQHDKTNEYSVLISRTFN